MGKEYQKREDGQGFWEVFDVGTGEVAKLGGLVLSHLDLETATGALDMLQNQILRENGQPPPE
ncbi:MULTISPECIES: hypothetical protein [Mesorhizobium]|uniref:hypothetical protein n=1 Tax=Mesorhizobium TaxID=68287 RepID=UPI000FEA64DE|nr:MULTISPECIES: hypothetical protein [unclassified Mesorhizobium]MDX8448127.1 hypothetical protein [Mesorhizobium sp. VK3C]MDX8463706.1 hypothetical protein [Mesorhizobium sp. VK2D]MDX8500883.1 hypothetical protein [Mesorhizobium sp. VK4C]RWB15898.1 MAG: hypothetical protein EOQ40_27970 [Mesorhizobium sp.]